MYIYIYIHVCIYVYMSLPRSSWEPLRRGPHRYVIVMSRWDKGEWPGTGPWNRCIVCSWIMYRFMLWKCSLNLLEHMVLVLLSYPMARFPTKTWCVCPAPDQELISTGWNASNQSTLRNVRPWMLLVGASWRGNWLHACCVWQNNKRQTMTETSKRNRLKTQGMKKWNTVSSAGCVSMSLSLFVPCCFASYPNGYSHDKTGLISSCTVHLMIIQWSMCTAMHHLLWAHIDRCIVDTYYGYYGYL